MRHSLFQKESSSIFQASEKRRNENVSKEKIRFQSTCLNYYVCYVCNKYLFNRVHLIWVIFRSIQPHDYQGIRHTLYALNSFTLEVLYIFPKPILFQPICPNSTRPCQNYKSLGKFYRAPREK